MPLSDLAVTCSPPGTSVPRRRALATVAGITAALLFAAPALATAPAEPVDVPIATAIEQRAVRPTRIAPTVGVVAKIVTLGDSYSSGTGIWAEDSSYDEIFGGLQPDGLKLTARSDNECWRELQDTPGPRLAAATGAASILLACKGAEAVHVGNQVTVMQRDNIADAQIGWQGSTILLTAGGNDIRTNDGQDWPALLERCITELDPFNGCHRKSKNQVSNWTSVENNVRAVYSQLASAAPNAKIRVMAYPKLMTPSPGCPNVTGVNRNEAKWIDDQVAVLNSKLQNAVASVKAAYPAVDIRFVNVSAYLTVGACYGESPNAHLNDRVTAWSGSGILFTSDASFHPTRLGYDAYYAALLANL